MKVLLAFVGIVGVLGCAKEQTPTPETSAGSATALPVPPIDLQLSEPMRIALNGFAPTFAAFTPSEYSRDVVADSSSWEQSRPFEARGDFNGDGLEDLALNGHDSTRELLIAILSQPDSGYRVYPLKEIGRQPTYHHDVQVSLTPVPPGPVAAEGPRVPASLPHGGIEVHYAGASEIYYWDGSRFLQFFTGD